MKNLTEEKKQYTAEEYFELEEASDIRHEYFNGEIFATASSTLNHKRIVIVNKSDIINTCLFSKQNNNI